MIVREVCRPGAIVVLTATLLAAGMDGGYGMAAEPAAMPPAPLKLEHAGETSLAMTAELWSKLPRTSVKVKDPEGKETTYEGVPMAELLKLVHAPLGKELRGKMLGKYVLVTAADDYRAVFALPEFDPESTDELVLLADRRDDQPLDAKEGPYRVIVPAEKKHARWVRQVATIAIRTAD